MTSLEYYIEQIEQFISALTDDIESGDGTVVTQTKLAVYREVLEHLEEIDLDISALSQPQPDIEDIVTQYCKANDYILVAKDVWQDMKSQPDIEAIRQEQE